VFDQIRRKQWLVGDSEERRNERDLPEDYESVMQAEVDAHAAADELRAGKRRLLPFVGGAAIVVTLVLLLIWRSKTT